MDVLDAAERFLWCNARLVERLRFEALFRDGDPGRVVAAVTPYQNPDGGFSHALEPDFRGPVSQPTTCETALGILDETGSLGPGMVGPMCDWLLSVTTEEGGVPMVLPSAAAYPRAPWWNPADEPRASILPTGGIAGYLHEHGVDHPWLGPATDFAWRALDAVPDRIAAGEWLLQVAYDVRSAMTFLDRVPDRARAAAVAASLGPLLIDAGVVSVDPSAAGELGLFEFAPSPDSLARSWFDDSAVDAHLDALVAGRHDDGGWRVGWEIWLPVTGPEWWSVTTVERLKVLRAYGRL